MSESLHLQADGVNEIANRIVKTFLRCYCSHTQDNDDLGLPSAESAYSSAWGEDLTLSPFGLGYGGQQKNPLKIINA